MNFKWNDWNLEHVGKHGVSPAEAEAVVGETLPPYPLRRADDKWLVCGPGRGGRLIQVIFVVDEDDDLYIIHARPLTEAEKRRYRRRKK